MSLSVALAGLPNAGKSTLFNALTRAGAAVGSYPFTTIEPNTGVVPVPDGRLDRLAAIMRPPRVIPATVTFTDVAGLVRGAHRGEGLGNQFLARIRECDALTLVVRAFEDDDVTHVEGAVDPIRDIDVVELELVLADLETVGRRLERVEKAARVGRREEEAAAATLARLRDHLDSGLPARLLPLTEEEQGHALDLFLLTAKPLLVVVNVGEADLGGDGVPPSVGERAARSGGAALAVCARLEAELAELEPEDRAAFLASLRLEEPGLHSVVRAAFRLLRLITFFTAGEKEVRAWTLPEGRSAIEAAAVIHTDFARGFIRAEVVSADRLLEAGSLAAARERGWQRLEGRDYTVRDGDVVHFRFNV